MELPEDSEFLRAMIESHVKEALDAIEGDEDMRGVAHVLHEVLVGDAHMDARWNIAMGIIAWDVLGNGRSRHRVYPEMTPGDLKRIGVGVIRAVVELHQMNIFGRHDSSDTAADLLGQYVGGDPHDAHRQACELLGAMTRRSTDPPERSKKKAL